MMDFDTLLDSKKKRFFKGLVSRRGTGKGGRISAFKRGGGASRRSRYFDRGGSMIGVPYIVLKTEVESNYKPVVGVVLYSTGYLSMMQLSNGVNNGDILVNGDGLHYSSMISSIGSNFRLREIKQGKRVSNIEGSVNGGPIYSRGCGNSSLVIKQFPEYGYTLLRLDSGKLRLFNDSTRCVYGEVSNKYRKYRLLFKAGQSRYLGKRPVVRGVAMNPIDHPHGGGEGKSSGGRCSVTPWGVLTKGYKTGKKSKRNKKNSFVLE